MKATVLDRLERLVSDLNTGLSALSGQTKRKAAREARLRETFEAALALIRQEASADVKLLPGRYLAETERYTAELRVDVELGVISMDVFVRLDETRHFRVSLRSAPGTAIDADTLASVSAAEGRIVIIAEDDEGRTATGSLRLIPVTERKAALTLEFADFVGGLPRGRPILLTASWQSPYYRKLALEIDAETDVPALPMVNVRGRPVTVDSSLQAAGFDLIRALLRDPIPKPEAGWDIAQLHGLMTQVADGPLDRRAFTVHLLLLSEARLPGLLGIMFDTGAFDLNTLPRQGAAVFSEPMLGHPFGFERKYLQTTVHELGHALNLVHRFERSVARADSLSFMNYDWRYLGGERSDAFWRDFRFSFDPDELAFLRHAPYPALIPGGAEFHTVRYWLRQQAGYNPYLPEVPSQTLSLSLSAPASGKVFAFGQPVMLSVTLRNNGATPLNIPGFYLDIKSGFLELLISKAPGRPAAARSFRPIATRNYDLHLTGRVRLDPGASLSDNLNLSFGSSGFAFPEPGSYQVQALLAIPDRLRGIQEVVRSAPLQLQIAYPHTPEEEQDALVLLDPQVGLYFALGGSDALAEAGAQLSALKERRQGKRKRIADPLVAAITRAQAINESRSFVHYRQGGFSLRRPEPQQAAQKLNRLEKAATKVFDPVTAAQTLALAKRLESELNA